MARRETTSWLYLAQLCLAVLGVSCIAGAVFYAGWKPPAWSYFALDATTLFPAGLGLLFAGWLAAKLPLLGSLAAVLLVLGACGLQYTQQNTVDVSRVLALSVAMLAVWFALQHRHAVS